MRDIRNVFSDPRIYQLFQRAAGTFDARLISLEKRLHVRSGMRVVDVGCGPGYLRKHLPDDVNYTGYDVSAEYIRFAQQHHRENAVYRCEVFDQDAARSVAPVDVIMMMGLLHHLTDNEARDLLAVSASSLNPGGQIFTLDGYYEQSQSWLAKKLLDWDRGRHVRTRAQYEALFPETLSLQIYEDNDLARIPYSWLSIVATKAQ